MRNVIELRGHVEEACSCQVFDDKLENEYGIKVFVLPKNSQTLPDYLRSHKFLVIQSETPKAYSMCEGKPSNEDNFFKSKYTCFSGCDRKGLIDLLKHDAKTSDGGRLTYKL